MEKEDKRKSDFDVHLKGVRLAVFKNFRPTGRFSLSSSPSRRVVDNGSKEAKYYTTFNGVADLVLLRAAIDQAIDWINRQAEVGSVDE